MTRPFRLAFVSLAFAAGLAASDDAEFFETKIRPLLATNCHACHTGGALGGLRLDTHEGVLAGGKSGKVVVEGKPEESLLIQAVRRTHVRLKMPPVGPLSASEVQALEEWVRRGVPWPKVEKQLRTVSAASITPEQRSFWSFQPVKAVPPPEVRDKSWPRNGIDRFVLAKLEAAKLAPSAPADKRTWIRRVTLDMTGLPPAAEEVEAYVKDASPAAKEKVVDRLLESPHYGERWARHWLDVARYSDGQLAAGRTRRSRMDGDTAIGS